MTERQKKIEKLGAKLDPDLRGFIDRVIVPILVRDYLADHRKEIASSPQLVSHSDASHMPSAEGVQ